MAFDFPPPPPLVSFNSAPKRVLMADGSMRFTPEFLKFLVAVFNQTEFFATLEYEIAGQLAFMQTYEWPVKTVSDSSYAISPLDYYLLFDTTNGAITATLPPAESAPNRLFICKNIGSNTLNIQTTGGQYIDNGLTGGGISVALTQPAVKEFLATGSEYFIVGS